MLSPARSLCWASAVSAIFHVSPGRRSHKRARFMPRLFLSLFETPQAVAGAVPIRLERQRLPVLNHRLIGAIERLVEPPEPLMGGSRRRPIAARRHAIEVAEQLVVGLVETRARQHGVRAAKVHQLRLLGIDLLRALDRLLKAGPIVGALVEFSRLEI